MSLYNLLFGVDKNADYLLQTLGLTRGDVGRFRDCYISAGKIVVYTRNGGGNREDYGDVFEALRAHKNYLSDEDDDFDPTYATITFSFPEEYRNELMEIDTGEVVDMSKNWEALIAALDAKAAKKTAEE